ncbi:acyltransferase family protein [Mediterraneibacter gnavus]|uniref:acyltransferase family protein n=1 Tax=Mediterraneibacter gnavus TaxID=33038 RepID=UPI0015F7F4B5|nr:acyltransferase family protein [Mediterraneibacter gnavus]
MKNLKDSSTQTLLYYESLDFLKGIAILMVIIVHTSQRVIMSQWYANIAMLGQLGCQMFFVISGFSLLSSFVHNHSWGSFLLE